MYEYEHKQDLLKRKSDCFEQLINKKPKLEDSSSRRKNNSTSKIHLMDSFHVPSPTNSRASTYSPGPSASQEMMIDASQCSTYSPGPSASQEDMISPSQSSSPDPSASQESLIDPPQSSSLESTSGSSLKLESL